MNADQRTAPKRPNPNWSVPFRCFWSASVFGAVGLAPTTMESVRARQWQWQRSVCSALVPTRSSRAAGAADRRRPPRRTRCYFEPLQVFGISFSRQCICVCWEYYVGITYAYACLRALLTPVPVQQLIHIQYTYRICILSIRSPSPFEACLLSYRNTFPYFCSSFSHLAIESCLLQVCYIYGLLIPCYGQKRSNNQTTCSSY